MIGKRMTADAVDRLAGMEAVARHHRRPQLNRDRDVRNADTAGGPACERTVVASCLTAGDKTQRLRQRGKLVHRRQRRERDVARTARPMQPIDEHRTRSIDAMRRHLFDHVVDTEHNDSQVHRRRRLTTQQLDRLRSGDAASGHQPPVHLR